MVPCDISLNISLWPTTAIWSFLSILLIVYFIYFIVLFILLTRFKNDSFIDLSFLIISRIFKWISDLSSFFNNSLYFYYWYWSILARNQKRFAERSEHYTKWVYKFGINFWKVAKMVGSDYGISCEIVKLDLKSGNKTNWRLLKLGWFRNNKYAVWIALYNGEQRMTFKFGI